MNLKKVRDKIKELKKENTNEINPSYDAYFKITDKKILIIQKQSTFSEEEVIEELDKL